MTGDNQCAPPTLPLAGGGIMLMRLEQVSLRGLLSQTRRTALHSSPPSTSCTSLPLPQCSTNDKGTKQVLHFSLMRFIFSAVTYERSKSNHAISYPLKLDMGQFLSRDAQGGTQEAWYDLKGVLMHKGQSAHHGHYVAQVHDARSVPSPPSPPHPARGELTKR